MTANDNVRINSGRARRGGGGGMVAGGVGGFGIIGIILYLILGGDPGAILGSDPNQSQNQPANQQEEGDPFAHCQTGADANEDVDCRMILTAESLDVLWEEKLPAEAGIEYKQPGLTLFQGQVNTGCGAASSAVGPFYCPADSTIYIDTSFFEQLETRLGAQNAPLAQMYIEAHEWGHHIQNQMGILNAIDRRDNGPDGDNVRSELQADCLAGVWVGHASSTIDPESGEPFIKEPTDEEIRAAQDAAEAVGDDRIQESAGQDVSPESWTHGSAEKRLEWFMKGKEGGTIETCDTFSIAKP